MGDIVREIVIDTETTGLDPLEGHRIVELGCVELNNHEQSGHERGWYINPCRPVGEEAVRVHGLTSAFLSAHPPFEEIADRFLDFIGDAVLVMHNAPFDVAFLNAELERCRRPALRPQRIIDTLSLAKERFPGARASLDALCSRFAISTASRREGHGALIDARLLARLYRLLRRGGDADSAAAELFTAERRRRRPALTGSATVRLVEPSDEEKKAHHLMLALLKQPLWRTGNASPAGGAPPAGGGSPAGSAPPAGGGSPAGGAPPAGDRNGDG